MAISYTPLEGGFINSISGNVTDITSIGGTSFFASTSFIYTLAFVVIIVAASFRYAYAGTLRLPGSEEGIRKSKEEFRRVTYGLLGVLGLWLILATVNKDMLTGNVSLGALRLERVAVSTSTAVNTALVGGTTAASSGTHTQTEREASHAAVLAQLTNIHTNHGDAPCSSAEFSQTKPSCTSLSYLPQVTIDMLNRLKRECNCEVVITGGTEPGHKTHGEDKRPVDLKLVSESDTLYTFIKNNGRPMVTGSCKAKYSLYGFIFWDECAGGSVNNTGRHWHVY